jgi:hypothetical protein
MLRVLRHILLLLVGFAIVGGPTFELARAAGFGPVAVPCGMAMPSSASGDMTPMTPCKGMTPDCIKQMGCVTMSALPVHFFVDGSIVQYSAIDYWTFLSKLASLDREPEPLPPRTV